MTNKPKIAIVTDPHFGIANFSLAMFEDQMTFFEKQFFPYILKNKIKHVICAGDFFHSREKFDWLLLDLLKDRFFKWFDDNGVVFHVLVGNHDTYYKDKISQNSLTKTTQEYKNIVVYADTQVKVLEKYTIGFVPWIVNPKTYTFPDSCDILIGHLELKDFPMMKGINSKSGYSHTEFLKYKHVFSGHYHVNFQRDNVTMVGTPYQLTWNDFNTKKGFYVLDDNFNFEFIDNTTNSRFVKLFYDNGEISVDGLGEIRSITKEESATIAKENFTRIYVKNADDQLALETYQTSLQSLSRNDYKITTVNLHDVVENFDSESFDEQFEDGESTLDLIISIIQGMTFETGIDIDKLIEYTKEEYGKAFDEAYCVGEES